MKRILAVFSILIVLSMILSACAVPVAAPAAAPAAGDQAAAPAAADGAKKTICFAYQDLETEFWVAGHKAIVETLSGLGVEVIETQRQRGRQQAA